MALFLSHYIECVKANMRDSGLTKYKYRTVFFYEHFNFAYRPIHTKSAIVQSACFVVMLPRQHRGCIKANHQALYLRQWYNEIHIFQPTVPFFFMDTWTVRPSVSFSPPSMVPEKGELCCGLIPLCCGLMLLNYVMIFKIKINNL